MFMTQPDNVPNWPYKLVEVRPGQYSIFNKGRGSPYPRFSNWDDAVNGMIALYKELPDSMFEAVLFNSVLKGQSEIFKVKTIQELFKGLNGQELAKRPLQTPANIPRRDYGRFKRNKF